MKEFIAVFQLSKTVIFEVGYYTLGSNKAPHFTTSAARFAKNKRDFSECGQAQNRLLIGHKAARKFYEKWDVQHLMELSQGKFVELRKDLKHLEGVYNCMVTELDEATRPYNPKFSFNELVDWSKQEPKRVFEVYFEDRSSEALTGVCKNKTEARQIGQLYIKQWKLNTKITTIREIKCV